MFSLDLGVFVGGGGDRDSLEEREGEGEGEGERAQTTLKHCATVGGLRHSHAGITGVPPGIAVLEFGLRRLNGYSPLPPSCAAADLIELVALYTLGWFSPPQQRPLSVESNSKDAERVLDLMGLERLMVVSSHVNAGNQTQVFCKRSHCS